MSYIIESRMINKILKSQNFGLLQSSDIMKANFV